MEIPWGSRPKFQLTDRRVVVFLVILGLVLYVNSLGNRMFWDDDDSVLNNKYVQDWSHIPDYFTKNLIAGTGFVDNYWRPVLLSSFSIDWHIWKSWPVGYHAVNAGLHILDAILLFLVLLAVFRDRRLAAATAAIFLAHPLQTEAVTYVAGRADPLSALFVLFGIWAYLRWRGSGEKDPAVRWYWIAVAMYALALMTKETAIVMPAYIFIADLFRQDEKWTRKGLAARFGSALWQLVPFLFVAAVYLLLRATVLNFQNTFNLYNETNDFTSNFSFRLFTFWRVLAVYAGLLFAPLGLHMERTVEMATTIFAPDVLFGGFLFCGLLAAAFGLMKRLPAVSFGAFWILIGLAPTSNLAVPINGLIYEHWLYLPLVGVFLPLVWAGLRYATTARRRLILGTLLAGFLIFLSVLTIARNPVWRDPIIFYRDVIRYNAGSYRIWNNLGNAYLDAKEPDRSVECYEKAIAIDPDNSVAYFNLANALRDLGRNNLAFDNYRRAIALQPKMHFYYNNLAALFLSLGRPDEARQTLEGYLPVAANKTPTYLSLIKIALSQADRAGAEKYLEEALLADPGDPELRQLRARFSQP